MATALKQITKAKLRKGEGNAVHIQGEMDGNGVVTSAVTHHPEAGLGQDGEYTTEHDQYLVVFTENQKQLH